MTARLTTYMPRSTTDISSDNPFVPSGAPRLKTAGTMKQKAQIMSIEAATLSRRPVDPLLTVPQAPGEEGHAEADEKIGEDRAGERGLDDAAQAVGERHHPDDQFRQVVEGRVDQPPGHRPLPRREVFGGVADQPDQRYDRRQGRD